MIIQLRSHQKIIKDVCSKHDQEKHELKGLHADHDHDEKVFTEYEIYVRHETGRKREMS